MKKALIVIFCADNTDANKNIIDINNYLDKENLA